MMDTHWLLCPVCKSKTRIKLREDTMLENFPYESVLNGIPAQVPL